MSVTKPTRKRALVREVNPHLICVLCSGYFIEATTIVECLHTFCRSCLVKYLENNKFCPICDVQLHKNNPLLSVRCDPILQQLVYKLIPGLYSNEMVRRRKYYSELGGPTSDPDCGVFPIGDQYFSPNDSISLSLEFISGNKEEDSASDSEEMSQEKQAGCTISLHHRRYLQCPAAVTMSHLKKFLRMKYCLSHDHKVDIIYGGEVLSEDFSLMDVAYTFSWNKMTPMRFKFRLLQRYTVPVPDPPPAKEVDISESVSSPALQAESEKPSPTPAAKEFPLPQQKLQLKTLTVQVQKLSSKISEPALNKAENKINKNTVASSVTNYNNNNNNNNNNTNNNYSNYNTSKVKPLIRHKPGPKSKTEAKLKMEMKSLMKTSPERGNQHLKRSVQSEENSKEINDRSKQEEPERKKTKLQLNEQIKTAENPPQIEPFKVNKQFDEKTEGKKKNVQEKERIEEKKDYDEEMYEIGKWHMDSKSSKMEEKKHEDKRKLEDNRKAEEVRVMNERNSAKEEKKSEDKKSAEDKKKTEENRNSEEKKYLAERRIEEANRLKEEKKQKELKDNSLEKEESIKIEGKKIFKEKSYIEKIQEDDDDDEDRLRILTPPVEEMVVEEKLPEPAPPPPVAEVQPMMRSEERRKEKKKNKKAKHHHHHRHHDRKRDSPPAATILHSPENDIMKLKIKLTEVNSKVPKYSVVDGSSDDRKESKENGHNHKSDKYLDKEKDKYKDKDKTEKNKSKEEEPKLIGEIISNKNEFNQNSRLESLNRDKIQPIRPTRPKVTTKQIAASKQVAAVKQDVANVKPMVQSAPIKIQSPPLKMQSPPVKMQSPPPRQSPSPKSVPTKQPPAPKPTPSPTPKINGTMEPLKMPPSTITVSKITAEEKRQMEQQKLLMSRNSNNGLDSKRPSLEIMLVNAPKKPETSMSLTQNTDSKPVEVKKVIRPTPPSIPLSRLGKGVGFGPKGSPPPLVLANKSCHDESGALDLSGKSSRKSPDIDTVAMRNLVTLSDTAVQLRNGLIPDTSTGNISQLKIPMPSLTKPVYQSPHQRTIKPGPNQTVRQIPNPSALMFRQHAINGRSVPPPGVPLSSLRKMESMTRNLEKVTAGLSVKAAVEAAAYATK